MFGFDELAIRIDVDGSSSWNAHMILEAFRAKYPDLFTDCDGNPHSVFDDVEEVERALECECLEYASGRWVCSIL